jgi:hypothetical protein
MTECLTRTLIEFYTDTRIITECITRIFSEYIFTTRIRTEYYISTRILTEYINPNYDRIFHYYPNND